MEHAKKRTMPGKAAARAAILADLVAESAFKGTITQQEVFLLATAVAQLGQVAFKISSMYEGTCNAAGIDPMVPDFLTPDRIPEEYRKKMAVLLSEAVERIPPTGQGPSMQTPDA